MNKKLFIPFIVFLSIAVINITSIISASKQHEQWRIIVASVSLALIAAAAVIAIVRTQRAKRNKI